MADTVIRRNIQARLSEIAAEKQRLQKRLSTLGELEKELRALLSEQPDLTGLESGPAGRFLNGSDRLMTIIGSTLAAGPKTLEELEESAAKYNFDFGQKSAKRVLHFKSLGMLRAGLTEKSSGKWRLTDEGKKQFSAQASAMRWNSA